MKWNSIKSKYLKKKSVNKDPRDPLEKKIEGKHATLCK